MLIRDRATSRFRKDLCAFSSASSPAHKSSSSHFSKWKKSPLVVFDLCSPLGLPRGSDFKINYWIAGNVAKIALTLMVMIKIFNGFYIMLKILMVDGFNEAGTIFLISPTSSHPVTGLTSSTLGKFSERKNCSRATVNCHGFIECYKKPVPDSPSAAWFFWESKCHEITTSWSPYDHNHQ